MCKALDKSQRKRFTLFQVAYIFQTDAAAGEWIKGIRWPNGPRDIKHKS